MKLYTHLEISRFKWFGYLVWDRCLNVHLEVCVKRDIDMVGVSWG